MNRGGSWNNNPQNLRSANRNRNTPTNRNNNLGFRVASTPHPRPARAGAITVAPGAHERRSGPFLMSPGLRPRPVSRHAGSQSWGAGRGGAPAAFRPKPSLRGPPASSRQWRFDRLRRLGSPTMPAGSRRSSEFHSQAQGPRFARRHLLCGGGRERDVQEPPNRFGADVLLTVNAYKPCQRKASDLWGKGVRNFRADRTATSSWPKRPVNTSPEGP